MESVDRKTKGNFVKEYLRTLAKHKFMVVIPLVVIFLGSTIFASTLPKVYKATALFRMLNPSSFTERSNRRSAEGDLEVMKQTILSRSNLAEVLKDVGLDSPYKGLPEGLREPREDELIKQVRKKLDVQQRANNVFEISYKDADPEIAARVANAVMSQYHEGVLKIEREQMESQVTFLEKKVEEYQSKVALSSEALSRFKSDHILELPGSELSNSTELKGLREQLTQAENDLSDAETNEKEIEKQLREVDPTRTGETVVETNPVLAGYKAQLDKLNLELATLKTRFTDLHPDVVKKNSEIESLQSLIEKAAEKITTKETREANPVYAGLQDELKKAQREIVRAKRRKEEVHVKIADCEKRVKNAPALQKQLDGLQQEDDSNRTLLTHYTTELENAKIEKEKGKDYGTRFRILDYARKSSTTASSNKLKVSLLGLLIGGGLGLGLAILKEQTDTSFKDVEDAASFLDVPIIGTIPVINTTLETAREKKRRALGWLIVGALIVLLGAVVALTSLTSFPGR